MTTRTITSRGIDTVEYGAVSGELSVTTTLVDGRAHITVAYLGAADTYTIVGSGLATDLNEEAAADRVAAWLTRQANNTPTGNAPVADLRGLNLST